MPFHLDTNLAQRAVEQVIMTVVGQRAFDAAAARQSNDANNDLNVAVAAGPDVTSQLKASVIHIFASCHSFDDGDVL